MIATEQSQDAALTREVRLKSFRGAQPVEHGASGGENSLEAGNLHELQLVKRSNTKATQDGHSGFISVRLQSTEWLPAASTPPEALATSLPPSPIETASGAELRLGREKIFVSPKEDGSYTNSQNGRVQQSTRPSSEMPLQITLSDTTPVVNRNFHDELPYRRPKSPSASSFVVVSDPGNSSRVPKQDWKVFLRLRKRVKLLRLQVQGQRVLVESKREELSDADEQYIKWIRTNHVTKENPDQVDAPEVQSLETLWKLCQKARDAYGPAADSLLSLEYGLEVEEARLEQIEGRVYGHLEVQRSPSRLIDHLEDTDTDDSFPVAEDQHDSLGSQSQTSSNPDQDDYNDYLWRLGNQDLLQEKYQGLVNERAMLEDEQERRQRIGLNLDSDDLDFLASFEETLESVRSELAEVAADVERLKLLCIDKGLIDINGNRTQASAEDIASTSEPDEERLPELPADYSKPSQHQNPSGNNEADSRVSDSHGGFGPFINLWLLHKLRSSAMEILLLACCVAASVRNMKGLRWQSEALRLWSRDGTEKNVSRNSWERNSGECESSSHQ